MDVPPQHTRHEVHPTAFGACRKHQPAMRSQCSCCRRRVGDVQLSNQSAPMKKHHTLRIPTTLQIPTTSKPHKPYTVPLSAPLIEGDRSDAPVQYSANTPCWEYFSGHINYAFESHLHHSSWCSRRNSSSGSASSQCVFVEPPQQQSLQCASG